MAVPFRGDLINLSKVAKVYESAGGRETAALADVTFSVCHRETFGVVGISGVGKSTLLRLLGGLDEPTAGCITVFGQEAKSLAQAGSLGFMFQRPTLYPWRTVGENISLPLELTGKEDRALVDHHLGIVGLEGLQDAHPDELSGGMQQRVALARALITGPSLLLLDEPFGSLDEVTRLHLNVEVSGILQKTAATTVLVTHSVTEVLLLADRIAVLTSSPGTVGVIFENPFRAPRDAVILDQPEFLEAASFLRGKLR